MKYRFLKCKNCGYMQQDFTAVSNFTLGVIMGLAIAALLYLLFSEKRGSKGE